MARVKAPPSKKTKPSTSGTPAKPTSSTKPKSANAPSTPKAAASKPKPKSSPKVEVKTTKKKATTSAREITSIVSAKPYRDARQKDSDWKMRYAVTTADRKKTTNMLYNVVLEWPGGKAARDAYWKEKEKAGSVTQAQKDIMKAGRY